MINDIVSRIDDAIQPVCGWCQRGLDPDCDSLDFCGPDHQQLWNARQAEPLGNLDEPSSAPPPWIATNLRTNSRRQPPPRVAESLERLRRGEIIVEISPDTSRWDATMDRLAQRVDWVPRLRSTVTMPTPQEFWRAGQS